MSSFLNRFNFISVLSIDVISFIKKNYILFLSKYPLKIKIAKYNNFFIILNLNFKKKNFIINYFYYLSQ